MTEAAGTAGRSALRFLGLRDARAMLATGSAGP